MSKTKLPADDLFEKSSMSFGEHLEELRRALLKGFLWLGAGTIIGLLFANSVVQFIETPLKTAIREFHVAQAKQQYLDANGEEASPALQKWMNVEGMMPERVFIDPEAMRRNLNESAAPASSPTVPQRDGDGEVQPSGDAQPEVDSDADLPTGQSETPPARPQARPQVSDSSEPQLEVQPQSVDASETSLQDPLMNPWEGIDLEQLERLQPMLLWRPIPDKLVSLTPTEGFMIWLKAALLVGVVVGSPGIFWHLWQFLAAGLYPHERRYVYWYLPLSLLLFLGGVCLAFFVVFRLVLGFLMTYTSELDVEFTPRLNDYMSFALFLPLGFGLAFQLPIVMLGLHRFGVISVEAFISQWRLAVLTIAFLSMLLTPAEIYSMIGLFVPMVGLYFFGIALCKYMPTGAGLGGPAVDPQG